MSENNFVSAQPNAQSNIQIGVVNKKSKTSNPLHYFPGIKKASLAYFRFKCSDVLKTMDFYQSLGMNLDSSQKLADGTLLIVFSFIMGSLEMNQHSVKLQFEFTPLAPIDDIRTRGSALSLAKGSVSLRGSKAVLGSISTIGENSAPDETRLPHHTNSQRNSHAAPEEPESAVKQEYTRMEKSTSSAAEKSKKNLPESLIKLGFTPDKIKSQRYQRAHLLERSDDYLAVYTRFFSRTMGKLVAKGFAPKLSQLESEGIKMAILEDPNGLEVWLMELPDAFLNEGTAPNRHWFGRVGYFAASLPNAEPLIKYYESLFSTALSKAPTAIITKDGLVKTGKPQNANFRTLNIPSNSLGRNGPGTGEEGSAGADKCFANKTRGGALAEEREGFALVDSETLPFGLSKTEYSWLANASREIATALCLVDSKLVQGISGVSAISSISPTNSTLSPAKPPLAKNAQKQDSPKAVFPSQIPCRSSSPFLGAGFSVPILDPAVKLLNQFSAQSLPEPPAYLASAVFVKDKGYVTRLTHPSWLQGCFSGSADALRQPAQYTQQSASDRKDTPSAASAASTAVLGWTIDICAQQKTEIKRKGDASDEASEPQKVSFRINPNYLKGHARSLSAGAVEQVKLEWWVRVSLPNPQTYGAADPNSAKAAAQDSNTSIRKPNKLEKQLLLYSRRHSI